MPESNANKYAVAKTVEMCKLSAKNNVYVKTVMASTAFSEPRDVLARFVVEMTSENKEQKEEAQVLNFSANRGRGNYNGNYGRGRGGHSRGYFHQNNNSQHFNRRNFNNGHNHWRGNGRGRGRGGHQNNRDMRVVTAGNEQDPSAEGSTVTVQQARQ